MTLFQDLHGLATEAALMREACTSTEQVIRYVEQLSATLYDCAERARPIEGAVVPVVMRETYPENVAQIPIRSGR